MFRILKNLNSFSEQKTRLILNLQKDLKKGQTWYLEGLADNSNERNNQLRIHKIPTKRQKGLQEKSQKPL